MVKAVKSETYEDNTGLWFGDTRTEYKTKITADDGWHAFVGHGKTAKDAEEDASWKLHDYNKRHPDKQEESSSSYSYSSSSSYDDSDDDDSDELAERIVEKLIESYDSSSSYSNSSSSSYYPTSTTPEKSQAEKEEEAAASLAMAGVLVAGLLVASPFLAINEFHQRREEKEKYYHQLEIEAQQQNQYLESMRKLEEAQSNLRDLKLNQEKERLRISQEKAQIITQETDDILAKIKREEQVINLRTQTMYKSNNEFYQNVQEYNSKESNILPKANPFTVDYSPYLKTQTNSHYQTEPKNQTQLRMKEKYKRADKRRGLVNKLGDPYK